MMRHFAILCGLVFASCGKQPAEDGYRYEGAQWIRNERVVELVTWPNEAALQAEAEKSGARSADGRTIAAFSRYPAGRDACQINIVDPVADYQPALSGHELLHCFHGNWHPSQP